MAGRGMFRIGPLHHRPRLWLLVLVLIAAMLGALWWKLAHWMPDRQEYPVQGVWLDGNEGAIAFEDLPAAGSRFVYVTASRGAKGRNDTFGKAVAAARGAGLLVGAVHRYDPCRTADAQSANFVTVVPREGDLLPPAVLLDGSGDNCTPRVRPAEVESELVTFLNQIESHAGQRAILAPTQAFEAHYGFGARAERQLWLARDWLRPDYAGRPWELWTANARARIAPVDGAVAWVVARP